jgi:hypothetical protein
MVAFHLLAVSGEDLRKQLIEAHRGRLGELVRRRLASSSTRRSRVLEQ